MYFHTGHDTNIKEINCNNQCISLYLSKPYSDCFILKFKYGNMQSFIILWTVLRQVQTILNIFLKSPLHKKENT